MMEAVFKRMSAFLRSRSCPIRHPVGPKAAKSSSNRLEDGAKRLAGIFRGPRNRSSMKLQGIGSAPPALPLNWGIPQLLRNLVTGVTGRLIDHSETLAVGGGMALVRMRDTAGPRITRSQL